MAADPSTRDRTEDIHAEKFADSMEKPTLRGPLFDATKLAKHPDNAHGLANFLETLRYAAKLGAVLARRLSWPESSGAPQ